MATLRSDGNLARVARDSQEEHPTNRQSRNRAVLRINEDCITQVSEEEEVAIKLSQEFGKTESRNLVPLSKLYKNHMNPQVRMQSGSILENSGHSAV